MTSTRKAPPSPNVCVTKAARSVLTSLDRIRRYRDRAAQLPGFDVSCFDRLRQAAEDALSADARRTEIGSRVAADYVALGETVAAARTERNRLRLWVTALVTTGVLKPRDVGRISRGHSYAAVATELRQLCAVFTRNANALQGKTGVNSEQISEATALADQIDASVSVYEHGEQIALATFNRNVVAERLMAQYSEVRRAIEFLRPRNVELDRIAPSLHARAPRTAARSAA